MSPSWTPSECAVLPACTLHTTPFPFIGPASSRKSVNPNRPSPKVTCSSPGSQQTKKVHGGDGTTPQVKTVTRRTEQGCKVNTSTTVSTKGWFDRSGATHGRLATTEREIMAELCKSPGSRAAGRCDGGAGTPERQKRPYYNCWVTTTEPLHNRPSG